MSTSITRRRLLAAGVAASSLALSGCFTPKLYKNDAYSEHVSAFMMTEDGKKLVVLGTRYHYIFDLPAQLRPVLLSGYRKSVRTTFEGFHASGGSVTGHYRIVLPKDASDDDRRAASADGFASEPAGLVLEGDIDGKRYSTEGFVEKDKAAAQPFNRPYSVYIKESPSVVGMGLRILATPITVAADGVLVLGGIVLVPFAAIAIQANGGIRIM
ncbi:TPA: hypothetical protein ACT5B2_001896 [Burkholderia cenocepacia]|jgi:hypothetical protein|uniref:5-formyltetrahydrofolate cyclo-ligase n=1 Tax=Burkholderia cenocepacia TaxID=95486 RepID=A0A1V2VXG1_9BURK|nr:MULTISPECIES: hypothetical protein [Burkholderia]AQQ39345.1 hypothetical protein A8E75_10180 [Burkholderia cenocepacia]ELW9525963.1 hypothetical protein [Burkholderia cenocepacia]MBG0881462.1 hypothetical protein [Burkholderia sp. 9775_39]MBG0887993.1 hypothetical protein [Burkholderia sp. 9773_38]MBR8099318.1 hypothetical protein [Burkholderia cenocepacia]